MDRTEYLKLCQQCSMFTVLKREIPSKMLVKHGKIVYYPYGYEMTFNKGEAQHKAILHSLKANAITYAKLERVERYEQNNIVTDSTV